MSAPRGTQAAIAAGAVYFLVLVPALMLGMAITTVQNTTAAGEYTCGLQHPLADLGPGGGAQQIGNREWTSEQLTNAQTIVNIAVQRKLPRRAAILALATAIVESQLINVPYGDRDSLGLFQQRPSQGWGTAEQVSNPTYATNTFYDRLLAVPGWQTMPPGAAEQAVQRSGFPDRYAPQEPVAADLAGRYWQGPDNPAPPPPGTAPAQVGLAYGGCPDQGGANLPLDRDKLPEGYQLPTDPTQSAAVSYALSQVGKPYVWGATGPDSFDCSGLMQAAWAHAGVPISRTTTTQRHDGVAVGSISQAQPGDLLFIPGSLGTASNPRHVGMYAGHGVVVNAFDSSTGVILQPLQTWTPQIVAIRRITTGGQTPPGPGGDPRT
ncbi:C40 family peptidase [Amycolatopsis magusensis]|uniref:C40 family peptidase n=1 Tax=Amycolatopsis magusensis TaxID=882444 RepID=UPI0037B9C914